jgi:Fe-S-cluster containining protein
MELSSIIARVNDIYRELAARPVERDCIGRAECCHFLKTGKTPYLTRGEAVVLAQALRASGRKHLPDSADGACPLLNPASLRCLAYPGRPFGCRTHYCKAAGGPYSRKEVLDLIRRLEDLDSELGGDGPRILKTALSLALEEQISKTNKNDGGISGKSPLARRDRAH